MARGRKLTNTHSSLSCKQRSRSLSKGINLSKIIVVEEIAGLEQFESTAGPSNAGTEPGRAECTADDGRGSPEP
jgi:hypothetical protein